MSALPVALAARLSSPRSHLLALRRSVAIAAVGGAVWLAILWSSAIPSPAPTPTLQVKAPEWTYRGASDLTPGPALQDSFPSD